MKYKSKVLPSLILLVAACLASAQDTETHEGHEVKAQQVLFRLANPSTATVQRLSQLADADDFRALSRNLNIYVLHSRSAKVAVLLNILKNDAAVAYIEPDYIVKAVAAPPNDTYFSQQWALLNTPNQGADIGATGAWTVSTGGIASVVGVVDTGIDYSHPDLAANVWSAPAPFTVSLSWGTLTCPAGSHGYNGIARSCDPKDDNGHGTHVSGTIGAVGNNTLGVAGVNWTARIMALKFLDSTGSGTDSGAIDALEFALQAKTIFGAAANVRVFSNSWGGSGFSQALLDEINHTNTADALFVVAAGNIAQNNDLTPSYPAAFTAPNIVTVAATTNTDALASFSSYGRNTVHLGAPGVNIISTWPNASYASLSGTSMATPHVSGAALLVLSACALNTAALKSVLLANVDPVGSLSGITATGGRLNVNKAIHSCANPPGSTGTVSFVKTDTTTAGSWKGVYGADGYNVIDDTAGYPAYVSATPSGNASYTWASSTTDARAMQKGSSASDRVAACWYSSGSWSIDLRFNDGRTHQVALYLLDWDNYFGRSQRVDILDANNTLLDSRSVSAFAGGEYLVWNLSGHVIVRITNLNGLSNAVASGLLFGAGGVSLPPTTGTVSYVKTDTTTAGSWKGVYGADGYNIINDTASYPAYVSATPSGNASYTWASSTTDARAMQKGSSASDRVAACWYSSGSWNIDLRFNDSGTHQVALYLLDWDNYFGRSERVDILDANNTLLDSRSVSGFVNGEYLVWNLSGHVIIRITNLNGLSNAVASGLLFGAGGVSLPPTTGTVSYVKTDTTTAGSWKGVYGADGYNIINDTASYPSYVSATPSGNASYTWASSTTDSRAMQKGSSASDRVAACWYSSGSWNIDLRFNDSGTHQVALYLLDWDNYFGRSQRVDILDANNTLLDSRSVSGFVNGEYLVWNLSGHVIVRITNTNAASNGVLSGILFR